MEKERDYKIRVSTYGVSAYLVPEVPRSGRKQSLALLQPQTLEGSNKDIEELLKGLLIAFENASALTPHYCVKKAKTSIATTRNAEGKLEFSLGLGIFKALDAAGNVKGERSEGIEIEIERVETSH